jgi:hypothetical protein
VFQEIFLSLEGTQVIGGQQDDSNFSGNVVSEKKKLKPKNELGFDKPTLIYIFE